MAYKIVYPGKKPPRKHRRPLRLVLISVMFLGIFLLTVWMTWPQGWQALEALTREDSIRSLVDGLRNGQ